jgi:hypothetical protein
LPVAKTQFASDCVRKLEPAAQCKRKLVRWRDNLCNPFYHLGISTYATPFGLRVLSRPELGFLWVVVSLFA